MVFKSWFWFLAADLRWRLAVWRLYIFKSALISGLTDTLSLLNLIFDWFGCKLSTAVSCEMTKHSVHRDSANTAGNVLRARRREKRAVTDRKRNARRAQLQLQQNRSYDVDAGCCCSWWCSVVPAVRQMLSEAWTATTAVLSAFAFVPHLRVLCIIAALMNVPIIT